MYSEDLLLQKDIWLTNATTTECKTKANTEKCLNYILISFSFDHGTFLSLLVLFSV